MKLTFLGTNGWYSTPAGDAICTLLEAEDFYVILDAGEGFRKLDKYIVKDKPVYLFLSHLHLDHVYGLHILPRMPFRERLTIVVPKSRLKKMMQLADSPYTASLKKMKIKILAAGTGKVLQLPFPCECRKLRHRDGAFGYRINLDGKIVAYCSDAAYDDESIKLAKDSDVLIHECTLKPGLKDGGWGHANPEEAARVAFSADTKRLVLTHFMPDFYPTQKSRMKAQAAARKMFKNSWAAEDDKTIII